MPITFGEARQALAPFAGTGGKCADDPEVATFVRTVLEYMLISGTYGNLRKYTFNAIRGVITLPYELDVPLKVRVNGAVGHVWDRWYEFHDRRSLDGSGCLDAGIALFEDPNTYPTVYDLTGSGEYLATIGTATEDKDAHIIVSGTDIFGNDVFTKQGCEEIHGEYVGIQKAQLRYGQVKFGTITQITKSRTQGYVQLFSINPETKQKRFLANLSPAEEKPSYRRYRLTVPCDPSARVEVLGRIRLLPYYADNDQIPFETMYTLLMAGQAINAQYNTSPEIAAAKDNAMQDLIGRENEMKRTSNGQPVEVAWVTSGGTIPNIVGRRGARGYLGRIWSGRR